MVSAKQNQDPSNGPDTMSDTIKGNLVTLRPFLPDDLNGILEHVNNPRTRYYINQTDITTPADKEKYIRSTHEKRVAGSAYIFAVVNPKTDNVIGSAGIEGINPHNKSCYFGIVIYNPENWDRGFGTETTRLMCSFAFNNLKMHSVKILVYDFNERAWYVYKKCGFRQSGMFRQGVVSNGKFCDVLIMDLLDGELLSKNQN